jgi:arylsulfatase
VWSKVPGTFTASKSSDVGRDTCFPVADAYFEKAPYKFEGTLKRLYFENLQDGRSVSRLGP